MNAKNKTTNFKRNKLLESIAMFFLKYHWAYKKGLIDGLERANYFKGYSDGQEDGIKYVIDSHSKFFGKQDFRNTGKNKI